MGVDGITAPLPLEDLLDPGGMTCTPRSYPRSSNIKHGARRTPSHSCMHSHSLATLNVWNRLVGRKSRSNLRQHSCSRTAFKGHDHC